MRRRPSRIVIAAAAKSASPFLTEERISAKGRMRISSSRPSFAAAARTISTSMPAGSPVAGSR